MSLVCQPVGLRDGQGGSPWSGGGDQGVMQLGRSRWGCNVAVQGGEGGWRWAKGQLQADGQVS